LSLIEQAKQELARINFGEEDSRVMIEIMEKFFQQWDSGGSVYSCIPVLTKLLYGKPLSHLTGEPDEWFYHDGARELVRRLVDARLSHESADPIDRFRDLQRQGFMKQGRQPARYSLEWPFTDDPHSGLYLATKLR
jgi:hypothetical protein